MERVPEREIRALFDDRTIRVYQAYSDPIADNALEKGRFVAPFSMTRMTWIKPSFCWMMYRAGWGRKDDGQRRILAIDITREGFEWALNNSSLRHDSGVNRSKPVRIQWDPERNIDLERLGYRSIQVGLKGEAIQRYVDEWTVSITEVTKLARQVESTRDSNLLPPERPYPVPEPTAAILGM